MTFHKCIKGQKGKREKVKREREKGYGRKGQNVVELSEHIFQNISNHFISLMSVCIII